MAPARYGPPLDNNNNDSGSKSVAANDTMAPSPSLSSATRRRFRKLIDAVLTVERPEHIPSLLTKNMDLLLTVLSTQQDASALVESILEDTKSHPHDRVQEAMDLTLSFAEEFVQQAAAMDQQNKELLGKILKAMSNQDMTERERHDALDDLFAAERDGLTAGFVRHLEAECARVAGAPTMTRESARLLETLHVIQARVVEELGQDLGEAAQVLGQLIGYDSAAERRAVLEAGLAVRGETFARELKALTEEALEGFGTVVPRSKVDPGLVAIVKELDQRLERYGSVDEYSEFA